MLTILTTLAVASEPIVTDHSVPAERSVIAEEDSFLLRGVAGQHRAVDGVCVLDITDTEWEWSPSRMPLSSELTVNYGRTAGADDPTERCEHFLPSHYAFAWPEGSYIKLLGYVGDDGSLWVSDGLTTPQEDPYAGVYRRRNGEYVLPPGSVLRSVTPPSERPLTKIGAPADVRWARICDAALKRPDLYGKYLKDDGRFQFDPDCCLTPITDGWVEPPCGEPARPDVDAILGEYRLMRLEALTPSDVIDMTAENAEEMEPVQ